MILTQKQAGFVDQLRSLAESNDSIYELLRVLFDGLIIDGVGNKEIVAEGPDLETLQAAQTAFSFAKLDRGG